MDNLTIAKAYYDAGLSLVPLRTDGSKAPACKWIDYTEAGGRLPFSFIARYFIGSNPSGIGIVCGRGLEVLDIEGRFMALYPAWLKMVEVKAPGLLARPVIVGTPKGGRHLLYRCEEIAGSQILAATMTFDGVRPLIETKGDRGIVVAAGSPAATHPLNKPYELLQGNPTAIPLITQEERAVLLNVSRQFNLVEKPQTGPKADKRQPFAAPRQKVGVSTSGCLRPGDRFNQLADWEDILEPMGWTKAGQSRGITYWTKPGSKGEHHATTNYGGSDRLYCFSTGADPFEAGQSYSKFAAYTLLNHAGDYRKAASELANHTFSI
jgi:hypothetical protein